MLASVQTAPGGERLEQVLWSASGSEGVIKAIRTLTGISLKEAKDASEIVGKSQTFELDPMLWTNYKNTELEIEGLCKILRQEGVEVSDPVYKILDDLRKLGSQALLQGEDELANDILQLVLAEKLRRQS